MSPLLILRAPKIFIYLPGFAIAMDAAEVTADDSHDVVLELAEVIDERETGLLRTELQQVRGVFDISDISVSVRRVCEAHGVWDDQKPSVNASLIIWSCKVFNNGRSQTLQKRRVKSLKVQLRFENGLETVRRSRRNPKSPSDDPQIVAYAPASLGAIYIMPTEETRSESTEGGIEGSLEGPAPLKPKISAHLKQTASREYKKNFAFKIDAEAQDSTGPNSSRGGENMVTWNMVENESQQDGISDTFLLCVVLQRPTAEQFVVHLGFDAHVDRWYEIKQKTNKLLRRWHPLAFNPQDPPNGLPENHSLQNLKKSAQGSILDDLAGIHFPELVAPKTFYSDASNTTTEPSNPVPFMTSYGFPSLLALLGVLLSFLFYHVWYC